jgi:hypothetical protein
MRPLYYLRILWFTSSSSTRLDSSITSSLNVLGMSRFGFMLFLHGCNDDGDSLPHSAEHSTILLCTSFVEYAIQLLSVRFEGCQHLPGGQTSTLALFASLPPPRETKELS